MKNKPRVLLQLFLFFLFMITFAQMVYAEGGQSSSPGASGQKPLGFVSISLEGGGEVQNATTIPTQPKFNIVFDKNVVNSTIWDNNRQCFSLISADNKNIPVMVSKIDDTVDFSHRQNIYVQPVNPLSPGTSYRLYISPDLQAKNGASILGGTTSGQGMTISFKTVGEATIATPVQATENNKQNMPKVPQAAQNDIAAKVQDNKVVAPDNKTMVLDANTQAQEIKDTPAGANTNLPQENKEIETQNTDKPQKQAEFNNWYPVVVSILIVGWISVEYSVKRKKR